MSRTLYCVLIFNLVSVAGFSREAKPVRVEIYDQSNLVRKDQQGKTLGVADEGWVKGRYFYSTEKIPFTGELILPRFGKDEARAIFAFKEGKQNGRVKQFYPSVAKKSRGFFKSDILQSAEGWHENGEKKFQADYVNGRLTRLKLWDESGNQKQSISLPKRLPSYLRELNFQSVLATAGISRVLPIEMGGLTLDKWLKTRANAEQIKRYKTLFANLRQGFLDKDTLNPKRGYTFGDASLEAYNFIRSKNFEWKYGIYLFYGQLRRPPGIRPPVTGPWPGMARRLPSIATGTGFFISKDGYFITNHHVIKDGQKVDVRVGSGLHRAKVVDSDRRLDLALLKVDIKDGFVPIPISSSNSVALGDKVYTLGFPQFQLQGFLPKYTEGNVSSLKGFKDDPTRFQISVPIQPGNSGGPLIDETSGCVVGVCVAKLKGDQQLVNYAAKSSPLLTFLQGTDVKYIQAAPNNTMQRKQSIERTKSAIGHIRVIH